MAEPEDLLRYACEDEAWAYYGYAGDGLWLASIAVSLKRIADIVSPRDEADYQRAVRAGVTQPGTLGRIADVLTGTGPQPGLYHLVSDLAFEAGQAFERGKGSV